MKYVIKRDHADGGGYVAKPGEKSYTNRLESARVFESHADALAFGVCGNEKALSIENAMNDCASH